MFPSLLPHTTRSTLKTAPKLVNFCACKSYFKNVVYSGATSLCGQILNYKNSEDTRQVTHTRRLPFTENSRSTYVSFENRHKSTANQLDEILDVCLQAPILFSIYIKIFKVFKCDPFVTEENHVYLNVTRLVL